jgi:hypothetical protein
LLGSWALGADQGYPSKKLHVVYASRRAITVYSSDRRFPDSAALMTNRHKAILPQVVVAILEKVVSKVAMRIRAPNLALGENQAIQPKRRQER